MNTPLAASPARGAHPNRILVIGLLLALAGSIACGKVGAPIPPAHITERTTDLQAMQRGDKILLTWPTPPLGQKPSSRSYIWRAEIWRLTEARNTEPVLDLDIYKRSARQIAFLERSDMEAQAQTLGHLECYDLIKLDSALPNIRIRYAIRYLNKQGQTAQFSNSVAIEPSPGISLSPGQPRVVGERQDAVDLAWAAPLANVDGTEPASVIGYNIYRRAVKKRGNTELLNTEPVTDVIFTDTKFEYKTAYIYYVRALSQGLTGLIESANSPPSEELAFLDTFAPAPPDPVSIASANGVISLFWPTSPEADVVGYNVYRADSADAPDKDWTKLNPELLTTVTYHDKDVVVDRQYFYRVTAVDRFDNASKPSKAASETAHP